MAHALKTAVIIVASGDSTRFGKPKLFERIGSATVLEHSLNAFQNHPKINGIVLVVREKDLATVRAKLSKNLADQSSVYAQSASQHHSKLINIVIGGNSRQASMLNGLKVLFKNPPHNVLVHDAARPLCSPALINRIIDGLTKHEAVVPVLPITDTLRNIKSTEVVDRNDTVCCQTPQGLSWNILNAIGDGSATINDDYTDDASMARSLGSRLTFVAGEERNRKLTKPHDIQLMEWIYHNPTWGI